MRFLRHRLAWVACAWVMCQIAAIAAVPVVVWQVHRTLEHADECECPVAPGQTCPMHHKQDVDSTCKMRNALANSDAALWGLAGVFGVLPSSTVAVSAFDPGDFVRTAIPSAIVRGYRPEAPPPRS